MERADAREEFDHFDRDNNGMIDQAEFTELMHSLDPEMSAEEIAIGFDAIDLDGNGMIDFEEFFVWMGD